MASCVRLPRCQLLPVLRLNPASSVDMTLPAHVTTISNEHGNYSTLALQHRDGSAALYLIYPAAAAMVCNSFALPSMLPAPRVLSSAALEAAGFTRRALQPLRDGITQQASSSPQHTNRNSLLNSLALTLPSQFSLKIAQYWLQVIVERRSHCAKV
jgi:hypothetical protein